MKFSKEELKQNIKLAAFDVDGTILPYKQKTFSNEIVGMFRKLQENNIITTLATAREMVSIGNLLKDAKYLDYFIGANGMFVYDVKHEKFVYEKKFDRETVKLLYDALSKNNLSSGFTICDTEYIYYGPGTYLETWFLTPFKDKLKPYDIDAIDNDHLYIITVNCKNRDETDRCEAIINELIKEHNLPVEINSKWYKGLFIQPIGVNKASTLHWLSEYLNLNSQKQLIAFGDSDNDIHMLQEAGYSVAMGNADDYIKAYADDVAPHVEENGAYIKLQDLGLIG